MKRLHNSAFTLIEVVILAIIMAVLAATIIPQFSSSTKDAMMSNLKFNLHMVRSQLEVYKEQHLGLYPPAATSTDFNNQMTQKSDQNTTPDSVNGKYGPYLVDSIPLNPFNHCSSVAIIRDGSPPTAPSGTSDGWQYNPATGGFCPNNSEYFQSAGNFADPK